MKVEMNERDNHVIISGAISRNKSVHRKQLYVVRKSNRFWSFHIELEILNR